MAITLKRRQFTPDEYHRMGEAGILGEDDRVELIEGEIVEMTRSAAATQPSWLASITCSLPGWGIGR